MRPSADPPNLIYIAFRRKNTSNGYVYKEFAAWLRNKSCRSCESVSIIAGPHPSEAPAEDITVLEEKTPRAEGFSAQPSVFQPPKPRSEKLTHAFNAFKCNPDVLD